MSALIGFGFVVVFGFGMPCLLGFAARSQFKREQRERKDSR